MKYSELAHRYASALFEIASLSKKTDIFLTALNEVSKTLNDSATIAQFVASPLIRAEDKVQALKKAFQNAGLPEEVFNFVLLLAKKNRLVLLSEIVAAYQSRQDSENGVTRGTVQASKELSAEQKTKLAKTISEITNKKVLLQYAENKSLIGGLVAQVGSLTFDDTLSTHLRRIKEDLTRRIN